MRWAVQEGRRNEMQQAEFWPQNGVRRGRKAVRLLPFDSDLRLLDPQAVRAKST